MKNKMLRPFQHHRHVLIKLGPFLLIITMSKVAKYCIYKTTCMLFVYQFVFLTIKSQLGLNKCQLASFQKTFGLFLTWAVHFLIGNRSSLSEVDPTVGNCMCYAIKTMDCEANWSNFPEFRVIEAINKLGETLFN